MVPEMGSAALMLNCSVISYNHLCSGTNYHYLAGIDFCRVPASETTVFVTIYSGRIHLAGTTCFGHNFSDEALTDLLKTDF